MPLGVFGNELATRLIFGSNDGSTEAKSDF